jgi:hypothetical protein
MRRAQFAFANGRMRTFRLRLKLPGFPTIFLGFSYIFIYIFFFLFFVFSTRKIRPKIFFIKGGGVKKLSIFRSTQLEDAHRAIEVFLVPP